MSWRRLALAYVSVCAVFCTGTPLCAWELSSDLDNLPPSAWIFELGGYGVMEPTYEGSKHYTMGFKPIADFRQAGDRDWYSFPNDATSFDLYEYGNFHAGVAGALTLKSRFHGDDVDVRLGAASVALQGGVFAEVYPLSNVRTRIEFLQGVTGTDGFAMNLAADYIWRPADRWTLTIGPRAQIVDSAYASDYFSTQRAIKNGGVYTPYQAEGGVLSTGAELTGKYDWTQQLSTKVFVDFNELMGDAADSPHVNLRGSTEQVVVGVGASYKFTLRP